MINNSLSLHTCHLYASIHNVNFSRANDIGFRDESFIQSLDSAVFLLFAKSFLPISITIFNSVWTIFASKVF